MHSLDSYAFLLAFNDTWSCCDGARWPCPNHLGPDWCLPLVFPDTIDSHPTLRHVASGNECPTGEDEDVINCTIPILQSELQATENKSQKLTRLQAALRLELDKIEGELVRLREHHDVLTRALDRRSGIMAPIRRLPTEILTDILWNTILLPFPFGHPAMYRSEGDVELESFQLVCRRWRRVVLQSPTLWSQIHIDPQASRFLTSNSCGARSLVRRMSRSAHTELDVKIYCLFPDRNEQPLPLLLVALLVQFCSRIRFLWLCLSPSQMLSLSRLQESFHLLRYLYVDDYMPNLLPLKLFDQAPKLVIYDTIHRTNSSRIDIPWSQILRYSASGYANILHALEGLEAAGSLQEGIFSIPSGSQTPLRVGRDPIVCTKLTCLTVYVPETAVWSKMHTRFATCSSSVPFPHWINYMSPPAELQSQMTRPTQQTRFMLYFFVSSARGVLFPCCRMTMDRSRLRMLTHSYGQRLLYFTSSSRESRPVSTTQRSKASMSRRGKSIFALPC